MQLDKNRLALTSIDELILNTYDQATRNYIVFLAKILRKIPKKANSTIVISANFALSRKRRNIRNALTL